MLPASAFSPATAMTGPNGFPLIVAAANALKVRSVLLEGEAVACDDTGLPNFDRLRHRRQDEAVFLFAFDLLELDGTDLRREPIETRKKTLASLLRRGAMGKIG